MLRNSTLGTHLFVLCKEVVLFWRLFRIECIITKVLLDSPLLRGLSPLYKDIFRLSPLFEVFQYQATMAFQKLNPNVC